MDEPKSPYLILFKGVPGEGEALLSEVQRQELMQRWNAWLEALVREGRAQSGVRLGAEGRTLRGLAQGGVHDGPFVETKEDIVGYFLVLARSLDEAAAIARDCPGLAYGTTVDVRPAPAC
jgi:hypothetical protein